MMMMMNDDGRSGRRDNTETVLPKSQPAAAHLSGKALSTCGPNQCSADACHSGGVQYSYHHITHTHTLYPHLTTPTTNHPPLTSTPPRIPHHHHHNLVLLLLLLLANTHRKVGGKKLSKSATRKKKGK